MQKWVVGGGKAQPSAPAAAKFEHLRKASSKASYKLQGIRLFVQLNSFSF